MLRQIAEAVEYYPFKGVEKFYDIGKLLAQPEAFHQLIDTMSKLVQDFNVTHVGALDARGFLFGAPVSLALNLPLAMVRKIGKMPNVTTSNQYNTEYGHRDGLAVQNHVIGKGARVVLIDDLVATGGSLAAAIETVQAAGGQVIGCVSIVELDAFAEMRNKILSKAILRKAVFTESQLLELGSKPALLPDDYQDDGETFETPGAMQKV